LCSCVCRAVRGLCVSCARQGGAVCVNGARQVSRGVQWNMPMRLWLRRGGDHATHVASSARKALKPSRKRNAIERNLARPRSCLGTRTHGPVRSAMAYARPRTRSGSLGLLASVSSVCDASQNRKHAYLHAIFHSTGGRGRRVHRTPHAPAGAPCPSSPGPGGAGHIAEMYRYHIAEMYRRSRSALRGVAGAYEMGLEIRHASARRSVEPVFCGVRSRATRCCTTCRVRCGCEEDPCSQRQRVKYKEETMIGARHALRATPQLKPGRRLQKPRSSRAKTSLSTFHLGSVPCVGDVVALS